jgi:hypothetical protein
VCQPDGAADNDDEQDAPKISHHGNSPVATAPPRAIGSVANFGDGLV